VVLQLTGEGVVPIARVAPRLPRDLSAMVDRMLSVERGARPWSLHEIGQTLERYGRGRAPSFGPPQARAGMEDAASGVPRSSRRSHMLAVVLAGLTAAGLALWWSGQSQS
jgi:hypothetical protein